MSFLDDLRADLKAMQQRLDAEDPFPEFVLATPDLKQFAKWFELARKKTFEGRCDGYRVIEDRAALFPFMMVPAKMLEAPKTLMEKINGG
jgi:hypothetical protein